MHPAFIILQLAAQYGPAIANSAIDVYETIQRGKEPTADDLRAIVAKVNRPYEAIIEEAKKRAGPLA